MTQHPTETPGPAAAPGPDDQGPRVTRDEVRDLGRLRRTRENRKVAGVAGGIARHLDIDPIIPRVALVVLAFFGGAGLLLYVACWLIVPVEGTEEATVRLDERSRTVALLLVGGLAALALLGDSFGGWGFPWPLAIIGVVVLAITLARGRGPRRHPGPYPGPVGSYPGPARGYAPVPMPPHPRRRGPVLFWYAVAVIALGCGVLGTVDVAGAPVSGSAYPALALVTCGVMLVLGAFWGRAGGLILLGLLSAVATAGATAADEVDAGHLVATPPSAAAVEPAYRTTVGEIELDLTEVADLEALDGRTIRIDVHVGRVEVVVPDGLDVRVDTSLDVGERTVFGESSRSDDEVDRLDGGADVPTLTLDVTVGLGEIDISKETVR